MDIYNRAGAENAVAQAIFNGIYRFAVKPDIIWEESLPEPFDEFVGRIAKKDGKQRRLVIPSVVVAQAIRKSAWESSELAREAKAPRTGMRSFARGTNAVLTHCVGRAKLREAYFCLTQNVL